MEQYRSNERGIALMAVFVMATALLALFGAYATFTRFEQQNLRFSKQSVTGFYSAEAGLNVRAQSIRQRFVNFQAPSGTAPSASGACTGANQGTGDYACETLQFNGRDVLTYVMPEPGNPYTRPIPSGERFERLIAFEDRYTTRAEARNRQEKTEAQLELRIRNRTVPLFQFAAFYNHDLEINNGAAMTLDGPVHTNASFFTSPSGSTNLRIRGQLTVGGSIYRGRKSINQCSGVVTVRSRGGSDQNLPGCSGSARNGPLNQQTFDSLDASRTTSNRWSGLIQVGVPVIEVPSPGSFAADDSGEYWSNADVRIVLPLGANNAPIPGALNPSGMIEVHTVGGSADTAKGNILNNSALCPGVVNGRVVGFSQLYDYREAWGASDYTSAPVNGRSTILDVDVRGLLTCLHNQSSLMGGKALNEDSDGGLVLYLTVKGPRSSFPNSYYGVRLRNAANLRATSAGAPNPLGLTIVSDQMVYVWGNYNASSATFRSSPADNTGYLPAAIMADAITLLSPDWQDSYNAARGLQGNSSGTCRGTTSMTVNAAFLSNTAWTGGAQAPSGLDGDSSSAYETYNGGLENYPRFLEAWNRSPSCGGTTQTLTYRGSFVSLGTPQHTSSIWRQTGNYYNPPTRNWTFDTNFRVVGNLPPRSPRFVYMKQELFVRDFEQSS